MLYKLIYKCTLKIDTIIYTDIVIKILDTFLWVQ